MSSKECPLTVCVDCACVCVVCVCVGGVSCCSCQRECPVNDTLPRPDWRGTPADAYCVCVFVYRRSMWFGTSTYPYKCVRMCVWSVSQEGQGMNGTQTQTLPSCYSALGCYTVASRVHMYVCDYILQFLCHTPPSLSLSLSPLSLSLSHTQHPNTHTNLHVWAHTLNCLEGSCNES